MDCINHAHRSVHKNGDNSLNRKAYEAPEMVKRMIAMGSIATESSDDNIVDGGEGGDIDWT